MKEGCLKPEEVALAIESGEGDARHRHLQGCAWCQALAASLGLFENDAGLPEGADVADAEARLGDFLEREIAGKPGQAEVIAPGLGRSRNKRRLAPTMWAAAAVLAVAVGLPIVLERGSGGNEALVLRSQVDNDHLTLALAPPEVLSNGDVRISWAALEGTTGYEVLVLDDTQIEVMKVAVDEGTSTVLRAEDLGALYGRPGPWFVVVTGKIDDDEIGRSLPRLLKGI